jgi:hypothetical protein
MTSLCVTFALLIHSFLLKFNILPGSPNKHAGKDGSNTKAVWRCYGQASVNIINIPNPAQTRGLSISWVTIYSCRGAYPVQVVIFQIGAIFFFFQEVRAALRWRPQDLTLLSNQLSQQLREVIEAAVLFTVSVRLRRMYFCQYWCNNFSCRAKVSEPYVNFNLHVVYNLTRMLCVSIASKSFSSPLCCRVHISPRLPNFGYLPWSRFSSIRN